MVDAVVISAGETAGTVPVSITVPVRPVTRLLVRTAVVLTPRAPTEGHAAVRGGWRPREDEVTVVRPAEEVSNTVSVSVAVSSPQTAGRGRGAAVFLVLPSVTVLKIRALFSGKSD